MRPVFPTVPVALLALLLPVAAAAAPPPAGVPGPGGYASPVPSGGFASPVPRGGFASPVPGPARPVIRAVRRPVLVAPPRPVRSPYTYAPYRNGAPVPQYRPYPRPY